MQSSVTLLPESDETTLSVLVTGVVKADDFEKNFIMPIKAMIASHGEFNLCAFYSDDYQGWDPAAAESSFKTYANFGAFGRRCAYINAPDSRHLILKMMRPIMPNADIRFFETEESDGAIAWAKGAF